MERGVRYLKKNKNSRCATHFPTAALPCNVGSVNGRFFKLGPQAGHQAVHTCTSWSAHAAMCGSSIEFHLMYSM